MDFCPTELQTTVREAVRDLCAREIAPRAARYDQNKEFPWENFRQLAQLGYLCMQLPEEYGGGGSDYVTYAMVIEELARACAATAAIFEVHSSLCAEAIYRWGSEEQKRHYLPRLARGELLGAYALTEPTAGSDPASIKTRAERRGDTYVLNGQKCFITNGGVGDVYIVMAATDPEQKGKGITAFIVEKGTAGLTFGKPEDKIGLHASQTTQMYFEEAVIPATARLGAQGQGLKIALATLDGGRIGIAAQAVGIVQAALDECLAYAKERQQFGRPIAELQAIQFKLSAMATDLEAARLLLYRAAHLFGSGRPATKEISMAKLFAADMCMKHTVEAVQIFGGYGYMNEYKVARLMRDAKITQIYEGTSEIQKVVIARHLLGAGRQAAPAGAGS